MGKVRLLFAGLFAAVLAAAVVAPAGGADSLAVAAPGSFALGYVTPVLVTSSAGRPVFVNLDVAPHDVVASDAFGPPTQPWCGRFNGPCPLFASDVVGLGGQTVVRGLDRLEAGKRYAFVCSIHANMTGTLIVQ